MTIKGPPIDSTQTGEVWDALAAVDEEELMPSLCPRPLTTPTPLNRARHRETDRRLPQSAVTGQPLA